MASAGEAQGDGVSDRAPSRVVIAGVSPEVDGGRFPIKRTVGEEVVVAADIFADGHDVIVAVLRHRSTGATEWDEVAHDLAGQRPLDRPVHGDGSRMARVHDPGLGRSLSHLAQGADQEARGRPAGSHQRAPGGGRACPRGGRARQRPRCRLVARAGPVPGGHGEPGVTGPGGPEAGPGRADGAVPRPARGDYL